MRRSRRGTALLVVVVVIMLLSLAAYNYVFTTQTEHLATALDGDRLVSQQAALSARDLVSVLLEMSRAERVEWGGVDHNPSLFGGDATLLSALAPASTAAPMDEEEPSHHLGLVAYRRPWIDQADRGVSRTSTSESDDPGRLQIQESTRYGAINESAKLHLLKLLEFDQLEPGLAVTALLQLPGMDSATAAALMDWIDADDEERPEGAESQFYRFLPQPLTPRQGMPLDLEELLFVRGITAERLFGTPPGNASSSDAPTLSSPRAIAGPDRPWQAFLTIHGSERNESYEGSPRIYINETNLTDLRRRLIEVFDPAWADFIILYRQYGPANSNAASDRTLDVPAPDLSVAPEFNIANPLDLVDAKVRFATGDEGRSVTVASPFRGNRSSMQTQLPLLLDQITVVPDQRVVGRINVNQAPAEVLAALPGLQLEQVRSIVAAREAETALALDDRQHPIWLLTEGHVDLETMRSILPHVTCGGDVYRAEIWGFVDDQSPVVRFETVLDASVGRTRTVYYRELSAPRDAMPAVPIQDAIRLESGPRSRRPGEFPAGRNLNSERKPSSPSRR